MMQVRGPTGVEITKSTALYSCVPMPFREPKPAHPSTLTHDNNC